MKKTINNLILLNMIFVVTLVIANVVTAKLIQTGLTIGSTPIALPGAAVCYAITFLMTDVIGQIWGKKQANMTVIFGFGCQILATLLIIFTQILPAVDPKMQEAYDMLLGQQLIFVVGSLIAYLSSQAFDVYIFHKIKVRVETKQHSSKHRWIWNNASTATSQIIDTVLFIGIAFGLGFGWLFDSSMLPTLFAMMLGQYIFKFVLALLDTPIFYLLTRHATVEKRGDIE